MRLCDALCVPLAGMASVVDDESVWHDDGNSCDGVVDGMNGDVVHRLIRS